MASLKSFLYPLLESKDDLKELCVLSVKTMELIEELDVYLKEPEFQHLLSKFYTYIKNNFIRYIVLPNFSYFNTFPNCDFSDLSIPVSKLFRNVTNLEMQLSDKLNEQDKNTARKILNSNLNLAKLPVSIWSLK